MPKDMGYGSSMKKRLARNLQYARARTRTLAGQGVGFNPAGVSEHTRLAAAGRVRRAGQSLAGANALAGGAKRKKR